MTRFRPCIDLHHGQVKQIVGGTLKDDISSDAQQPKTNFISILPASHYASLYRRHRLTGGHVIMLGPGNTEAAKQALQAWPQGLQVGGGITADNAAQWLACGASHVIVTSYLFPDGRFSLDRLRTLCGQAGGKHRVVIDLSCRRRGDEWVVAMNKWQTLTDTVLSSETVHMMAEYADEFLIHAADVEGLCCGIDEELVEKLGEWSPIPCTYAGGGKELADLDRVAKLSNGRVDLTFGSALDLFGGKTVRFDDCVEWNKRSTTAAASTKT